MGAIESTSLNEQTETPVVPNIPPPIVLNVLIIRYARIAINVCML